MSYRTLSIAGRQGDAYCLVTVQDVYNGQTEFREYTGYEYTGEFRPPMTGEHFLNLSGIVGTKMSFDNPNPGSPRLIMVKRNPTYIKFTYVSTRVPQVGDWISTGEGGFAKVFNTPGSATERPVYVREEVA